MPVFLILIGYLLGAIPTAYIAGRIKAGKDIRQMGDENAGAGNAYRELGPRAGIIVAIIDIAKGILAVVFAQSSHASLNIVMLTGTAAVIGHNWPFFLGFRGGRGVSTAIGILLVLVTIPMLILALPTLIFLIWKKNVTPAMAFLFILLPFLDWWLKVSPALIAYGLALPALVGITTFFRTRPKTIHQIKPLD
jgi:acyl phosphate:glycerol-3-phosphate acyltransferase